MRLPDVTPTSFEIAMLKWVAIPLLLIGFARLFKNWQTQQAKGKIAPVG